MIINSEKILNEFLTFSKILIRVDEPHLISFSFQVEQTDSLELIDGLNNFFDNIFLFQAPDKRYSITGINTALELNSSRNTNFLSVSDSLNHWKKNTVKNWNEIDIGSVPLICCAAKFDFSKSSELWKDFDPLNMFIPEFIFLFKNDQVNGFFNFIMDNTTSAEIISNKLKHYLKIFTSFSKNPVENFGAKIKSQLKSGKEQIIEWQKSYKKALDILHMGTVEKLVLSRINNFTINDLNSWTNLLRKLFNRFNDCYLFFIKRKKSFFFGSSPEMFLKITNNFAEVESVAGSAPRGEGFETDHQYERLLKTSKKNHLEHHFVSEYISEILFRYSDNVSIIEEKQIRKLDNIQHLITKISAELNSNFKLFELIDSLFPTPAVCGVPKDSAMNFIRKLESHDRGLYSGLVGVMDFNGDCELAVSIRSALIKDNQVTAFAGAGLVKDSISDEEFFETNLKLNTILSLFDNENKSK